MIKPAHHSCPAQLVVKNVMMQKHVPVVLILTNLMLLLRNVGAKQELGQTVLNAQRILKIAKPKQKLIFVMPVMITLPKNPQLEMQNLVKQRVPRQHQRLQVQMKLLI